MTKTMRQEKTERQLWMGLLARARPDRLAELFPELPAYSWLRSPEIGAVMVTGRTGGTGQPFNIGEMTVTRCALRLDAEGAVGHAYVQGRDRAHAARAAVIDALMQTATADDMRAAVLMPLQIEETLRRAERSAKAAATQVKFFTLVRGEDQ